MRTLGSTICCLLLIVGLAGVVRAEEGRSAPSELPRSREAADRKKAAADDVLETEVVRTTAPDQLTRTAKAEDRCALEGKVVGRISRFEQSKLQHRGQYHTVVERLEKIITLLQEKGYTTTELASDLEGLKEKVATFSSAYEEYAKLLAATKEGSCMEDRTEFKRSLTAAREQLKVVKQAASDVRKYWKDEIRPDFVALKQSASPSPVVSPTSTPEANE